MKLEEDEAGTLGMGGWIDDLGQPPIPRAPV